MMGWVGVVLMLQTVAGLFVVLFRSDWLAELPHPWVKPVVALCLLLGLLGACLVQADNDRDESRRRELRDRSEDW